MIERLDYDAVERVEAELDSFVEKRAREREDANKVEALWATSEARHRARQREENREAWHAYERHMASLHAALAAEHEAKAEALTQAGEGA